MLNSTVFLLTVIFIFTVRVKSIPYNNDDIFKSVSELSALDDQDDAENKIPIVPKRAALLLDKLIVALQKAVGNNPTREGVSEENYRWIPPDLNEELTNYSNGDTKTVDLQRRGQTKGRIYWRCYFNAVSCFKRKR